MRDQNKDLVLKFLEMMDAGDMAGMATCMSSDVKLYTKGYGAVSGVRSGEDLVAAYGSIKNIFPGGVNINIVSVTAEGNRVAVEWEANAVLYTGAEYKNQYVMIFAISNGRISQINEYLCTKLADDVMMRAIAALGE